MINEQLSLFPTCNEELADSLRYFATQIDTLKLENHTLEDRVVCQLMKTALIKILRDHKF